MRQMLTEKEVKSIISEAILDDEIPVPGLTPEREAKIDNSLQLPESAPANQILVGINTSKEQNDLELGNNLKITNNKIEFNITQDILSMSLSSSVYAKTYTAENITRIVFEAVPGSDKQKLIFGQASFDTIKNNNFYKMFLSAGLQIAYESLYASISENKIYFTMGIYNPTNADITISDTTAYLTGIYYC